MKWWLGGLVLVAGLASAFNVVSLRLEHIMDPRWGARDIQLYIALIVIGVVIVLAVESDVLRGYLEERFRVLQAARA